MVSEDTQGKTFVCQTCSNVISCMSEEKLRGASGQKIYLSHCYSKMSETLTGKFFIH